MAPGISIIEDDPDVARIVERVAGQTGLRVTISASAAVALGAIVTDRPRLVIADVNLPDLRGPELVRRLRAHGVSCPVLFISGDSSLETLDDTLDIAQAMFLPKPFSVGELREAIWSALAQR